MSANTPPTDEQPRMTLLDWLGIFLAIGVMGVIGAVTYLANH